MEVVNKQSVRASKPLDQSVVQQECGHGNLTETQSIRGEIHYIPFSTLVTSS